MAAAAPTWPSRSAHRPVECWCSKIYPDAGHSFMNHHEGALAALMIRVSPMPLGYRAEAAEDSWRRILAFFEKHLGAAPSG